MPPHQSSKPDFSRILTPDLYTEVLRLHFPWKEPANIKDAVKFYFLHQPDNVQERFDAIHFRATKPISSVRPEIPSLWKYLPGFGDSHFPEHALALVCLLDQMPRSLYHRGVDSRYIPMFFDEACKKVVKHLVAEGVYPDLTEVWKKRRYTFEDAMLRKLWLYAPLAHSEDLSDHGLVGPKRVDEERGEGPPMAGSAADLLFWIYRVLDAHTPILKEYGRYPYHNESVGRESTPREKEYLKATHNLGAAGLSEAEAEKLRKEVRNGVWEDLSDEFLRMDMLKSGD
ncbi:hypothetical protein AAF712_008866 [Marasmius tenuissimus]|uniref:Uncharacterized protein n=1 Tax=Marasmius tenuissimus TaxID=585030 RepID=A0ABR2ZSK0_9AGAR